MIFEKHSVHLNRLESFYLMPFASYLTTPIISGFKYYSYIYFKQGNFTAAINFYEKWYFHHLIYPQDFSEDLVMNVRDLLKLIQIGEEL